MLLVGAIENLKVGHQKEGVCVHQSTKRWEKNHMQSDSDSTMCAKNSDILLAENSLMDTEISISDEGSHAGEKEQYLNASLSKLQMFPSTSTFCTSEKSTYVFDE
ncbi:hypothetical protein TNCV_1167761 [Trichonephila clavipes]|uniref:Uncharacterized protein n=1 Tax=Trichonephila clavipes TaxID=2585209 RepID=A0A8X6T0L6_TRICX|nr:hypothetical protein TNCV_1167761 [Trichonephila clavipes]